MALAPFRRPDARFANPFRHMKTTTLPISPEALESRIAPAGLRAVGVSGLQVSADGKTATFTDVDGDLAAFVTTKGAWTQAMFDLTPTGNFVDGSALNSVTIPANAGFDGANITITAKRDLFGGNGAVNFQTLDATGVNLGKVTLHGALGFVLAGTGDATVPAVKLLQVQSLGELGAVNVAMPATSFVSTITGNLGKLVVSSDVRNAEVDVTGTVNAVTVGGSFLGGKLAAGAGIGTITVRGDVVGSAAAPVVISAFGQAVAPAKGVDTAIAALAVGGRLEFARILAGYGADGTPLNADASVGTVTVGTDWIASTLLAGTGPGVDSYEGTADDVKLAGAGVRDNANLFSTIAALTIKGQAYGTVDTTDSFGIVAEQIKKAKLDGVKLPFVLGARTVGDTFYAAPTGPGATGELSDFAIFEVQM
jgi:hypothetical protein